MCGITGIINLDKSPVSKEILKSMNDIIDYRGPDDEGFYFDDENGVGLGHRRLSIIDLSPLGHQPMSDGNIWITYNGEVYNYLELMDELKALGYSFKSKSDTEVIINAYKEWGEDCVKRFNGMWGFAIWDKNRKKLFCSRDRMRVKPFYYFHNDRVFLFSSEIKQILLHPEYKVEVNKTALYDYLVNGIFNTGKETFYENIYQIEGASSISIDLSGEKPVIKENKYWDIDLSKTSSGFTDEEYSKQFFEAFKNSVNLRLRSDVPVGSCLSGGLDSSSIVCMVNKILKDTTENYSQKTFSAYFPEGHYDEREFIDAVGEINDIERHYISPEPDLLKEEFRTLIWHMDGPTLNGSIFCQRNVFKLAKQNNVTVMLDGQGGDELLAGYHNFFWENLAELLRNFKIITLIKEIFYLKKIHNYSIRLSLKKLRKLNKKPKKSKKLKCPKWLDKDFFEIYSKSLTEFSRINKIFCNSKLKDALYKPIRFTNMPALLHYEDRNSMAFSIESRVPFLDYKLVELAFSLPDNQKIRNGTAKYILRAALKDILPEKVLLRQDKVGFESPDSRWLGNELKEFFMEAINSTAAKELGIFDIDKIKELFSNEKYRLRENQTFFKIMSVIIWYDSIINNYSPKNAIKETATA